MIPESPKCNYECPDCGREVPNGRECPSCTGLGVGGFIAVVVVVLGAAVLLVKVMHR